MRQDEVILKIIEFGTAICAIAFFWWLFYYESAPDPVADKALQETSYILEHQNRIKKTLKDPGSAQFQEVFISTSLGTPVVCGLVNSKNSFGAYGGLQKFVSAGTIQAIASDMPAAEMDSLWASACIKK